MEAKSLVHTLLEVKGKLEKREELMRRWVSLYEKELSGFDVAGEMSLFLPMPQLDSDTYTTSKGELRSTPVFKGKLSGISPLTVNDLVEACKVRHIPLFFSEYALSLYIWDNE